MPANFLGGCEAVDKLVNVAEGSIDPVDVDRALTQMAIGPDSDPEELRYLQEPLGVDSLGAVEAADAADSCGVCSAATACQLGSFLRKLG